MTVIHTEDLCKGYGLRRGIRNVNLSVAAGEVFGFLGPNGAGKSTTIRLLLGFLRASGGTATVLGMDCWTRGDQIRQQVGYVAGDVRLYPWLTARRAFEIVGQIRRRTLQTAGMSLCDRFQLEPDLPVRKMSRGNRQKVALVLALVHEPQVIILDEPTSGLDPLIQDTLSECLLERVSHGSTVFFSSHTLSEVESLCTRVAIVRDGRIVADEKLATLQARAPRTVTITFHSPDEAAHSVLPEEVRREAQQGASVRCHLKGSVDPLIRWAAANPPADLIIERPSLETLFRKYYEPVESATLNSNPEQNN
ncbi:MAG: ABC transporter ATP-binding protein [Planctomycetaceae bacterium]